MSTIIFLYLCNIDNIEILTQYSDEDVKKNSNDSDDDIKYNDR